MNNTYPEKQVDKQDAAEVKNYTRIPNMLIFGYQHISPQEKWLLVCLRHLCGKKGTRHLSLRYISEQTGISVGALSVSKDKNGKVNQGMMRHLHEAGLIHCEIKKHEGKGNPQYHVTITDVWSLNQDFFSTRSEFGQDEQESGQPVQVSDKPVRISDDTRSGFGQARPNSSTILRLDNKTITNTTEQEETIPPDVHTPNILQPSAIATAAIAHAPSSQQIQDFATLPAKERDKVWNAVPVTYAEALDYLYAHGTHEGLDASQVMLLARKLSAEAQENENHSHSEQTNGDDNNDKQVFQSHTVPDVTSRRAVTGKYYSDRAVSAVESDQRIAARSDSELSGYVHGGVHHGDITQVQVSAPPTTVGGITQEKPPRAARTTKPKAAPLDFPLVAPDMAAECTADAIVQYTEWRIGKRYLPGKPREKQLDAARRINREHEGLTLERYALAYTDWYVWWSDNDKGLLHVSDMACAQKNGIPRVQSALERIDARNKKKPAKRPDAQPPASPSGSPTTIKSVKDIMDRQNAMKALAVAR